MTIAPVQPRSRLGLQHPPGEGIARGDALQDRIDGGDDQARRRLACGGELGQRVDAPRGDLAVGRDPVIGQAVPGREGEDVQPRRKEGGELGQLGHARIVARDMQHRAGERALRQRQGVHSLGRAGDEDAAGGGLAQYIVHSVLGRPI